MVAEGQTKLLYLESLRGLAALVVVFTHFAGSFLPSMATGNPSTVHSSLDLLVYQTPLTVFIGGNFAVCIFFVLSGFVLTRAYFAGGQHERLAAGAFKRYFRLMPPVLVSVLMAFALVRLGLMHNQEAAGITLSEGLGVLWGMAADFPAAVWQGLVGVFAVQVPGVQSYNPVLWTMHYEFVGSFMVFGLAALLGKHPRRWWLYPLLIVVTLPTYYLGFALGMMLADAFTQPWFKQAAGKIGAATWSIIMTVGLFLGGFPSANQDLGTIYRFMTNPFGQTVQGGATWHAIGAALVVVALLGWPLAQRLLSWRPLVGLGRMSFGLYLTHFLVIASFSSHLFISLISSHGYRTSVLVAATVSLAVIMLFAQLFTRWVDEPTIAWANQLGRHRS